MVSSKRVMILQLHHLFGIHPIHHSIIQSLIDNGDILDLVYADYSESSENFTQYKVEHFPLGFYHGKSVWRFALSTLKTAIGIWRMILSRRYRAVVVLEPQALIAIFPLLLLRKIFPGKIRVVYVSLEILFMNELKRGAWRLYKRIERAGSRLVDCVVSQDGWRAGLLQAENSIPQHKMLCIPNCEFGESRHLKRYYLHDLLGIERERKILLCLGTPMFMSVFLDNLLVKSKGWGGGWVLVVHSGVGKGFEIPAGLEGKVYFTSSSLPYRDIGLLYESADVGLAVYVGYDGPTGGRNLECVGYSSGKFNMFLKYGKPVITTAQYTFCEIFEKSKCGIAINNFSEIPAAMTELESNYPGYSRKAVEFYNNELKIDRYAKRFIDATR